MAREEPYPAECLYNCDEGGAMSCYCLGLGSIVGTSQGLSGTLVVAIASVLIASLSLGWQVWSWRRARKTKLRVELTAGVVDASNTGSIICRCTNDSSHDIFIERVSVGDLRELESPLLWMTASNQADIKEPLRPHQGREYEIDGEAVVETFDPAGSITVTVHTSDDRKHEVRSGDIVERLAIVAVLREETDSSSDRLIPTKELSRRAHEKYIEWILRSMERDGIVEIDTEGRIYPLAKDVHPPRKGGGWRLSDRRFDEADQDSRSEPTKG
jgi:hypothetical protein